MRKGEKQTPEELAKKLAMPLDRVRKVLKISKEPVSLETPVGDEEDSSLGDFIEDQNALQPPRCLNKIQFRRINYKNFSYSYPKRRKSS